MNFIFFNILLLFAGFPAVLLFSFGLMACIIPLAPFVKGKNPPKSVIFSIAAIAGGFQIYFWGLWAAFCVAVTMKFTQKPEVTWDWLYWICGFMWCTSLIGWLAHKEQQSSATVEEARRVQSSTTFYSLIAIAAFLIFAFAPSLAEWPYGWFMNLTGLSEYMNG
jgi:hypothetical protein